MRPSHLGVAACELSRGVAGVERMDPDPVVLELVGMASREHAQRRLRAPVRRELRAIVREFRVEPRRRGSHAARDMDNPLHLPALGRLREQ